ncbi:hypothetical protein [uncultured Legionella sp.]|uniref:hypothetical protein n=1 Tax=uncultured Legionella sp. TaxID=210934 RepID=UPI00260555AA|nr:hypothetical protein [uncultured Legionella sp.]
MYRLKQLFLIINLCLFSLAASAETIVSGLIQNRLDALSAVLKNRLSLIKQIDKEDLPTPFDYLLTQPLLTVGIETFYKRTSAIRVVHAERNIKDNVYTRVITMILDQNSKRNNPAIAERLNEQVIVELALISIYFNELPADFIHDILTSDIPFGRLLKSKKIETNSKNQYYFSTVCNTALLSFLKCQLNSPIYGRINTIVRTDNNRSIAQVIELLPVLNIVNN